MTKPPTSRGRGEALPRSQRGEKPYQAHIHGAAGLIMYNDPADDGYVRGVVYPDGPWRAPQRLDRGTLYRWSLYSRCAVKCGPHGQERVVGAVNPLTYNDDGRVLTCIL